MKKLFSVSAAALAALLIVNTACAEESNMKDVSYALSFQVGQDMQQSGEPYDAASLVAGFNDAVNGKEPRLTEEAMQQVLAQYRIEYQNRKLEQRKAQAGENTAAGEAYQASFKENEGVVTTESGLLYQILEPGEGEPPSDDAMVKVHYEGTLLNGTVFDSSYQRGEPLELPVNGVIPGWREALQIMKPGAKFKLVIPPELAYGARGAGNLIGPNATLVFTVELLEVMPALQAQPES